MTKKEQKVIPIFKAEGYYIPVKYLESQDIEKAHDFFTYSFYNDKACSRCENFPERHNDICDSCASFKGRLRTSKTVLRKGKSYLRIPGGARSKLKKWLIACGFEDNYEIKKRHPDAAEFSRPIRFKGTPYPYQEEAKNVMIRKKRGILESPPRSGKTVMFAMVVCEIGKKTLILAHQREWLLNFQETFVGSDKVDAMTNCKQRQIGICKSVADFHKYDICLATFATFFGPSGKQKIKEVKDLFGVIGIDEVHGTPAKETAKVASKFNAEFYFGLSGTVERKVATEIEVALDVVGPIIHECEVERLVPRAIPFFTHIKFKDPKMGNRAGFSNFQTKLEVDKGRESLLIREIIKYAKAGHLVLLPMTRVNSVMRYTQEINRAMEQKGFALPFFGGMKKDMRQMTIQKARDFECRVVVGNIALLSTGVNIPRASCIFEIGATNNVPKCDQRVSRILTPMEDKPEPTIVLVLDESDMMRKCRRAEWWGAIHPRFNPNMHSEHRRALMEYFADKPGIRGPGFNTKEGV